MVGLTHTDSQNRRGFRSGISLGLVLAVCVAVLAPALSFSPVQSAQGQAQDPVRGKELYGNLCEACHNQQRFVGPALIDDVGYFVRAGIPVEMMGMLLQKPVRAGHEGSIMPVYTPDQVSDADLNDIGAYLASYHPAPAAPPQMGSAEQGGPLYAANCAMCHGDHGEGVQGMTPVAFMAAEMKQHNLPPNIMLAFVMLSARSGDVGKMPVFSEDSLSDTQLDDIAAYIWDMPVPEMPGQAPAPAE